MGALQAPDLALASQVIVNPTGFFQNVESVARGLASPFTVGLGFAFGREGGVLGLGVGDQREGLKQRYQVAKDDMDENIVRTILRNPLLLGGITDAQIAAIAPDIGAPLIPYLQANGRNPWQMSAE